METTLDEFGRIVIPKKIREELYLKPGEPIQLEILGNKIVLKIIRDEPSLKIKEGVLVFSGIPTEDIKNALHIHREQRLKILSTAKRK